MKQVPAPSPFLRLKEKEKKQDLELGVDDKEKQLLGFSGKVPFNTEWYNKRDWEGKLKKFDWGDEGGGPEVSELEIP